jgi:hypothetical protein
MTSRISYFFSLFLLLPLAAIYSAELDDLEARIDQMLERLNKVESSDTKRPIPEPPTQVDVGMETEMGLPTISLPSLPPEESTPSNSEASQALDQLEGRIDNLLRRLNMESTPFVEVPPKQKKQPKAISPEPQKLPESMDPPNSFALPDNYSDQNLETPPLPKNRFNFYIGLTIPGDSVYSHASVNQDTEFGNGFEIGLDYNRMFEDGSYIGAFVEGKFFDTEKISGVSTSGDNRLLNLGFTLGQDWSFSELLALKTQASIGTSITHYEIDSVNYSANSLGFHYSFLAGLEFRWNEYWQTSLYYEFDGRSSADRMDYQSFHQLGIETGIGI